MEVQVKPSATDKGYRVIDRRGGEPVRWGKHQQKLFGGESGYAADFSAAEKVPDRSDVREGLEEARSWQEKNLFFQKGLWLKMAVLNWGFTLKPEEKPTDAEKKAIRAWWKKYGLSILEFNRESWLDFEALDNTAVFWRVRLPAKTGASGQVVPRALVLWPEKCAYTDALGMEKLKVQLEWSEQELKSQAERGINWLSAQDLKRYSSSGLIELDPAKGEYFKVLKRTRAGKGFAWPRVAALFHGLNQMESMEVSDRLWAFVSRACVRLFKMGHECRYGPAAGSAKYMWAPERHDAVMGFFEGRLGNLDATANFDFSIEYPFPSGDRFDAKKYESVLQRLALWLGPVGLMLFGFKGNLQNDFLMRLLKAEAAEERRLMGLYQSEVINTVYEPPVPIECSWSDKIFQDSRIWLELLKFLHASGPLSQTTALREADYDPLVERSQKIEESEQPMAITMPLYDAAHGPVSANGSSGGRPAGAKDGGARTK